MKGEVFELIKEDGAWYLVQTPKYVGWLHGNTLEKVDVWNEVDKVLQDNPSRPRTTSKATTGGDSVFESQYVGIDYTIIEIVNNAGRTLTLTFGGVRWTFYVVTRRS